MEERKWKKWDIAIFIIAALVMLYMFVTAFHMMLNGTFGTL